MFSMIGLAAVQETRVLDLYAGTGALGIEALSRAASHADFVESHAVRCRALRDNLAQMGLADRGRVRRGRVPKVLDDLGDGYDLVFIDPPYDLDPWEGLMGQLAIGGLLNRDATVVAEHRFDRELPDRYGRLVRTKLRRHGDTGISIYVMGEALG
jgi:16S rRNA (guanine(966)-N(2))-methyltransferase RsmD